MNIALNYLIPLQWENVQVNMVSVVTWICLWLEWVSVRLLWWSRACLWNACAVHYKEWSENDDSAERRLCGL